MLRYSIELKVVPRPREPGMVDFTEQTRREAKVLAIQRQIEEGVYDESEAKLEAAIDKMLDLEEAGQLDPPPKKPKPR